MDQPRPFQMPCPSSDLFLINCWDLIQLLTCVESYESSDDFEIRFLLLESSSKANYQVTFTMPDMHQKFFEFTLESTSWSSGIWTKPNLFVGMEALAQIMRNFSEEVINANLAAISWQHKFWESHYWWKSFDWKNMAAEMYACVLSAYTVHTPSPVKKGKQVSL